MFSKAIVALISLLVFVTADEPELKKDDEKSCMEQVQNCTGEFASVELDMWTLEDYAECVENAHCDGWEDEAYRKPLLDTIWDAMESMEDDYGDHGSSTSCYAPMIPLMLIASAIRVFL